LSRRRSVRYDSEEDNLHDWNDMVSDKETCECSTNYRCSGGGNYCSTEEDQAVDRRSVHIEPETDSDEHLVTYQDLEAWAPGDKRESIITFPDGARLIITSEEVITWMHIFPLTTWMDADSSC
jgi:hypothetical protein